VISAQVVPLENSAMMSTLTTLCQWEDETAKEKTGHSPAYAVAKKMKLPTTSYPSYPVLGLA